MLNRPLQQSRKLALLTLAGLVGALGAATMQAPAVAAPSASKGATTTVSASLKYVDGSKDKIRIWSDIRVSIVRNGAKVTDAQSLPAGTQSSFLAPPKLLAIDLDDDRDPEVMIDVFTAGAECCRRTVLMHHGTDRYDPQTVDWGNGGYRLQDVVGGSSPEFLSADARFPELFNSNARGPLRVQSFRNGRLADVSRHARSQLSRDARRQKRAWAQARKAKTDVRPALAAYAVDLIRLGREDAARQAIRSGAAHGELQTTAKRFSRRIDSRMVAWGYAPKATPTASRAA